MANDLVRHHALRDSLPPSSHPLGTPLLLLHTSFQPGTLGERDFLFLLRCSSHSAPLCPQGGQPRQLRNIKKKCQAHNQKFRLKACLHATTRPHPAESLRIAVPEIRVDYKHVSLLLGAKKKPASQGGGGDATIVVAFAVHQMKRKRHQMCTRSPSMRLPKNRQDFPIINKEWLVGHCTELVIAVSVMIIAYL